jgi:hypothetical protein
LSEFVQKENSMTALTQPFEAGRKDGESVYYPVAAGQLIYKGALVVTRGDGYVYNLRGPAADQNDVFLGLADETVDNVNGSAGALSIHVLKRGSFVKAAVSATQSLVAQAVYGVDDATVSTTSTNAVLIGYVTELIDSATVRVRIDRAVQ